MTSTAENAFQNRSFRRPPITWVPKLEADTTNPVYSSSWMEKRMTTPAENTSQNDPYDIGEPAPQGAESPAPAPRPTPPKDPETGRFLKTPSHPERLVRMAKDLGFGEDEIRTTPTEELRTLVHDAGLERLFGMQSRMTDQALEPARQAAQQLPPEPSQEKSSFDVSELEETYTSDLVGFLKNLAAKVQALEQAQSELPSRVMAAQQDMTRAQRIDAVFAKHPEIFGKGPITSLKADSHEALLRQMVVKRAAPNVHEDDWEKAVTEAVHATFPHLKPAKPEQKPNDQVGISPEQWLKGGVAVPTQRQGSPEPEGPARAVQGVRDFYRENGADKEPTITDEFPD